MTTVTSFRYRPALYFGLLLLGVVGVETLVTRRPDFATQPLLPAAVTFDLLVGLPLAFYWVIVRSYRLPLTAVVGAFSAAVGLAYYLLPPSQQLYLGWTRYGLAGLEMVAIILLLLNVRRLTQAFRRIRPVTTGYPETLSEAFTAVFQRPLVAVAVELSLFYYALLSWRATPEVEPASQAFPCHRESGTEALLGAVALVSVAEMAVVHLLLQRWWPAAAGWALVVHLYGLLFLVAHIRAVRLRPTLLTPDYQLVVRVGFLWKAQLPLCQLETALKVTDTALPPDNCQNLARPLLTPPNLVLTFSADVVVTGPYGLRRTVRQLSCFVDQPDAFLRTVSRSRP